MNYRRLSHHPSRLLKCIPAGALRAISNSSIVDSGDEWDKTETVGTLKELHSYYENRSYLGRRSRGRSGRRNGEKPGPVLGETSINMTPAEEEEN